jgi:Zn-dependent protease with chaperone function
MADIAALYPPTPTNVPPDLTKPSGSYRTRVVVVLVSLFLFLGVYLGLIGGSAYLCYRSFAELGRDPAQPRQQVTYYDRQGRPRTRYERRAGDPNPIVLIPTGIMSGLLGLFLVKGLFKRGGRYSGIRIEVTETEQPDLFAFIRQVCRDTRAPFPHKVYLLPEVTAAVAFDESVLNLVFPSKKNLIIGLALVNRLNLAEFKAVLAHEFGHFSQNSMRLGSYVYTANRVIGDVVYGRDWLDDLVSAATRIDLRISVFVWVFQGGLWVVRKGLHVLFRATNFANTALSRQMEYNADLVAVSVTGSDPLVFALARLEFADQALGQAWGDLMAAADHGRYTRDIYHHHTKAADFLKAKRGDDTLGEVPELPADPTQTVAVFKPEDTTVPAMWATHPPNPDRERNAKARYVRGPADDRPAWVLFRDGPAVREAMAWACYKHNRKEKLPAALEDPGAVQAFIDAEHAETTYPAKYHGLYENRYVRPGELAELVERATWQEFDDPDRLAEAHAALAGDDLKDRMAGLKKRQDEQTKLTGIARGFVALAGKDFEHRGNRYGPADAKRLLTQVEEEVNQDFAWMHLHDRSTFRVHYAMATQLGGRRDELAERYRFHLAVQALHQTLVGVTNYVNDTLASLQGQRQVAPEQFQRALGAVREARKVLNEQLGAADELAVPALTNMTPGSKLGPYLFEGTIIKNLPAGATQLDGKWINDLLTQIGEVTHKAARILFKSLGGILALQDAIAADWHARRAAPPAANDADTRGV